MDNKTDQLARMGYGQGDPGRAPTFTDQEEPDCWVFVEGSAFPMKESKAVLMSKIMKSRQIKHRFQVAEAILIGIIIGITGIVTVEGWWPK